MKDRKLVAELIYGVLAGNLIVREALEQFPAGIEDASLQCAWYALVHREADEDFRKRDSDYAREQDEFLNNTAYLLKNGESLPQNIIAEYNKYYEPMVKSENNGFINTVKSLFRFIT